MNIRKAMIRKTVLFISIAFTLHILSDMNAYSKQIKAESISTSKAEKIVDIVVNDSSERFALTDKGEVYAWGKNRYGFSLGLGVEAKDETIITKPRKLKCNPGDCEGEYLENVKKIVSTNKMAAPAGISTFALTNDGKIYAWGANAYNQLGFPETTPYYLPTLVNLDFLVKDGSVAVNSSAQTCSFIIAENGDLYTAGKCIYSGLTNTNATKFTKVTTDINGQPINNVKQVVQGLIDNYFILEDNSVLYKDGYDAKKRLYKPLTLKDGTKVENIDRMLTETAYIDIFIDKNNRIVYGSSNTSLKNPGYNQRENNQLTLDGRTPDDFVYYGYNNQGPYMIDKSGKIFKNTNADRVVLEDTGMFETLNNYLPTGSEYSENDSKSIKIGGSEGYEVILKEDGSVYEEGLRVSFGNLKMVAKKADNTVYHSEEKYNDKITITIDESTSDFDTALKYIYTDLETNEVSEIMDLPSSKSLDVNVNDQRVHGRYEIYQENHKDDTLVSIDVDLFKKTPAIEGLKDGAKYEVDKSFTLPNDWNPYTATLQKDSDPAIEYISGTSISEQGNYVITLTDTYGNEKAYNFSITDKAVPENLIFTKYGELIYKDDSTLSNSQIGTLSLKYPDGAIKIGELKTAVLGSGGDEDKFLIDATDNTKLMVKESLDAGDYVLHVSGTDTNDMNFEDVITITIEKAKQNDFKFDETDEIFYGDILDLNTIVTGGEESIPTVFTILNDNGSGAVNTNGKLTTTNIGSFEIEAKKEDPKGNYKTVTIKKTILVKPKPITISVKEPIKKKPGMELPEVGNNYEITPELVDGDVLEGTPVFEYVGSADDNSLTNVKVRISGLSNKKYDITFQESDVTVEQDGVGIEGVNYEITGTKGKNNWYTSDVTFKLLAPSIELGYDLISNTKTFTADHFIINSEGEHDVTFRMKNSETKAFTSEGFKKIKIDKTKPIIDRIEYAEMNGNTKTAVSDKEFDYYFVHGADIKLQATDITSGIAQYKMTLTTLNDDGSVDETKSKDIIEENSSTGEHTFVINKQGNFQVEVTVYDEAGNSVSSSSVKIKINEKTGELIANAFINGDRSKPYDGTKWTNQSINVNLECTNPSGVTDYFWSKDGIKYTKMTDENLEIPNTETIKDVEYTFKAVTVDGNELTATLPIKIDVTKPKVTGILYEKITRDAVQSFLNAVSFDQYFKEEQTATFLGEDKESGIDTFEYSITKVDKELNSIGNPDKGKGSTYVLELDKNYKIELYAIDKAGNKSSDFFSETVSIDPSLGDLELKAYVNDDENKPYDGTKWVHEDIAVHLNVKDDITIDEYAYSSGGSFIKCDTNICTIPATSNIDDKVYTFRIKDEFGETTTQQMNIKMDITKPKLSVHATSDDKEYIEGSTASEDITLTLKKDNTNLSGTELFYTKDAEMAAKAPSIENGWRVYKKPILLDTSGEETYFFASVSGAGLVSDIIQYETKLVKLDFNEIIVEATSHGKPYSGEWTNDDVTFTISGGIEDISLIQNYEYTITDGTKPDDESVWNSISGTGQHIVSEDMDKTIWFRVVPNDPKGSISKGYKVKIDTVKPDKVTFKTTSISKGVMNSITDLLATGEWSNKSLQVEMESKDEDSGLKEITYIETKNGNVGTKKVYKGPLIYKEDCIISFKAIAYDNAGNASENESLSDTYRIDLTPPTINGAEDGKTYYYVPRFITYEDLGSGIKDAIYTFDGGVNTDLDNGHKLSEEGVYAIRVSDNAGNIHVITFEIVGKPDMDKIDGSDESREIIDQVIDEYKEVEKELTAEEKKEIVDWIEEAEKKWEDARKKVIEDPESGSSVEGLDDVNFDPNTKLIVKKDNSVMNNDISKVPGISKKDEIKEGFDVKLKKGEIIVQPDGSVIVRIRNEYKYASMKVVMFDENGEASLVEAEIKNDYVEFITDKPNNKFAFVGEKERDPNVDKDTDNDGFPDVNVDVNGDGKADINIDTNGDGVPDINIDTDGDGKPDYNIDINGDGKPDVNIGPVDKPWKPDLCVDYDKDGTKDWCTSTKKDPYLNIDTDGDGRPDINLDIDGDKKPDLNIDTNFDNIPDLDIDTDGDGKADINIDDNNDGKADRNIKKITEWKPDKDCTHNNFKYDTMSGLVPDETSNNNNNNGDAVDGGGSSSSGNSSSTSVKGATTTKNVTSMGGAGTGDTTQSNMWIILMISGFTMIVSMVYSRKRKRT